MPAEVRYVVLHRPGPAWQPGLDFREQPGVMEHVAHCRRWHEDAKRGEENEVCL